MSELWLPVVDYEGSHRVSDQGNVQTVTRQITRVRQGKPYTITVKGQPLVQQRTDEGYLYVELSLNGARHCRMVHCLVLDAFEGLCPPGLESRHLNGRNDDNARANLAWGTHSENMHDKLQHGTDHNANKTRCPAGHEYTPDNTYVWHRRRHCKKCGRDAVRRYRAKRKAA